MLARLYEYYTTSAALAASLALAKCYPLKILCDWQGAVRRTMLYRFLMPFPM